MPTEVHSMSETIDVRAVDHIGIRVADADRAMKFYALLGFELLYRVPYDAVTIIRNKDGVEINLIHNANDANNGRNILMDVPQKYAGYTHVAFRVASINRTMKVLADNGIVITQGPVTFGDDGNVSVFVRDPDRNVIELRGRQEDVSTIAGAKPYVP
jgi:lactoylglutathione lyase